MSKMDVTFTRQNGRTIEEELWVFDVAPFQVYRSGQFGTFLLLALEAMEDDCREEGMQTKHEFRDELLTYFKKCIRSEPGSLALLKNVRTFMTMCRRDESLCSIEALDRVWTVLKRDVPRSRHQIDLNRLTYEELSVLNENNIIGEKTVEPDGLSAAIALLGSDERKGVCMCDTVFCSDLADLCYAYLRQLFTAARPAKDEGDRTEIGEDNAESATAADDNNLPEEFAAQPENRPDEDGVPDLTDDKAEEAAGEVQTEQSEIRTGEDIDGAQPQNDNCRGEETEHPDRSEARESADRAAEDAAPHEPTEARDDTAPGGDNGNAGPVSDEPTAAADNADDQPQDITENEPLQAGEPEAEKLPFIAEPFVFEHAVQPDRAENDADSKTQAEAPADYGAAQRPDPEYDELTDTDTEYASETGEMTGQPPRAENTELTEPADNKAEQNAEPEAENDSSASYQPEAFVQNGAFAQMGDTTGPEYAISDSGEEQSTENTARPEENGPASGHETDLAEDHSGENESAPAEDPRDTNDGQTADPGEDEDTQTGKILSDAAEDKPADGPEPADETPQPGISEEVARAADKNEENPPEAVIAAAARPAGEDGENTAEALAQAAEEQVPPEALPGTQDAPAQEEAIQAAQGDFVQAARQTIRGVVSQADEVQPRQDEAVSSSADETVKQTVSKKDEIAKLHRQIYMRKQMLVKRNPGNYGYARAFDEYKTEAKKYKKAVKSGEKTEDEYLGWLLGIK
ncbi:MAG: hypothetical protein IKS19_03175 [Clostridia bacterium]|nr:hypothetical protein [Clostridia bacterium]